MGLPYENSSVGDKAFGDIERILRKFGCSQFGVLRRWDECVLVIQFRWRERDVVLEASWKGYAEAYLREHPYSSRMRRTRRQHEEMALKQGSIAVCSILRDWVKGQVTAVECGLLSFEAVFLPHMLLPTGHTVLSHVHDKLLPPPETDDGS